MGGKVLFVLFVWSEKALLLRPSGKDWKEGRENLAYPPLIRRVPRSVRGARKAKEF